MRNPNRFICRHGTRDRAGGPAIRPCKPTAPVNFGGVKTDAIAAYNLGRIRLPALRDRRT
jgi:hypothetical protein